MEEKAILKLLSKFVKSHHPEIEWFDIIYDSRNGLCEITVNADGTEYEQEQEIEDDIIFGLTKIFNMNIDKIKINHNPI